MGRLIIFLVFISCAAPKKIVAPQEIVRCLRSTLIPNSKPGGWWRLIQQPPGSTTIVFPVKGSPGADNPCLDLNWCGAYKFKYYNESTTCVGCIDSSGVLTVNYTLNLIVTTSCVPN